ncbi:hypothetical protein FQN54_007845 [Arachnomyces sp. PD_36]|nr:hypothetical protein FQN54_007845 [Arachnomyces sp. PD_36]
MGFISRLFSGGRGKRDAQQDDDDLDDEVFPIHFLDMIGITPHCTMGFTFQYDDVLDPEKLHGSLVRLLEMEGWRKMGGRLRRDKKGKPEIRVPRKYTPERPAVAFSHVEYGVRVEEHPLASRLHKSPEDGGPSIQDGHATFREFTVPPGFEAKATDWFRGDKDKPITSLLVSSFTDGTIVSIVFPHIVLDAVGLGDLLRAWSNVLADRIDRIPPVLGSKRDVLENVGTSSDEKAQTPYILEDYRIKGFSLLAFAMRLAWDVLTMKLEPRTIVLPAGYMSHLRQQAESELCQELGIDTPPFISDGDIITAWCSRMISSSTSPRTPSSVINIFDLRSRLDDTRTQQEQGTYLQNLLLRTCAPMESSSSSLSLGQVALRVRQAIVQQTTDTQIRSDLKLVRGLSVAGFPPLFGSSPFASFMGCSNWEKAKLQESANFADAVVIPSSSSHNSEKAGGVAAPSPGACVGYSGSNVAEMYSIGEGFVLFGKGGRRGEYMLEAGFRGRTWGFVRREFERYEEGRRKEKGGGGGSC